MCGEQWLNTGNPFVEDTMSESKLEWLQSENKRLTSENEQLVKDLHRIDFARQTAVTQCGAMAERIKELEYLVMIYESGAAVGERGAACVAIDGGNL